MMADRMRLLGTVLGVLTLVLLLEWVWPTGSYEAGPPVGLLLPHDGPRARVQARAASAWAESVLARPLFSISRRPPKVQASAGTAAAPDQARLSGILIGRFGKRAIFAPEGGGKPLVLGEGASVNESTIRSIEPNQVVLTSGTVLIPSFDKNRVPSQPYVPPFQPPMQGFPQPPFPNGQLPGGAFPMQRSVMPQPAPEGAGDQQDGAAVPPPGIPQPVPVFRGPMIPQRRE
jgi:hypothetical protein